MKPIIKKKYGATCYYILKDGREVLHREDGPAIECANGSKWWYINGKRHREDGTAIEYANGTKAWYINGKQVEPIIKNEKSKIHKPIKCKIDIFE